MAVISAQAHVLATAATAVDKENAEWHIDHAITRASHLVQQLLELARVMACASSKIRCWMWRNSSYSPNRR